jgi:hypothetical protein
MLRRRSGRMSADYLDLMQWPAMLASVIAAWLTASLNKRKRMLGFWFFLVSNLLWALWGWHDEAYAVVAMQAALAALNVRGVFNNET